MAFGEWLKNIISVPVDEEEEATAQAPEETPAEKPRSESRVRSFSRDAAPSASRPVNDIKVVLAKPETFEDGRSVADHLNAKRTVVLNLEGVNKDICRRLLDFFSGVAYANDAQVKRVANSTYIITPKTVDVMGDMILDELESSGLYINV